MRHLHLSGEELAARHPSILVPPEEHLQDVQCNEDDAVYACEMFARSVRFAGGLYHIRLLPTRSVFVPVHIS